MKTKYKLLDVYQKNRWLILGFVIILLTVFAARYLLPGRNTVLTSNPVVGGAFTLVDTNNHIIHESDFRGKAMLVFFGYTHCPDICPATLTTITAALDKLPAYQSKIAPIFITVDPARDTTAVMADYLKNFHSSFIGLTGSQAQIDEATKNWKIYAQAVDVAKTSKHEGKEAKDTTQETAKNEGNAVKEQAEPGANKSKESAKTALDATKHAAEKSYDTAKDNSKNSVDTVKKSAEKDLQIAKQASEKAWKTTKETAEKATDATKHAAEKTYDTAKSALTTAAKDTKNTLDSAKEKEHKMDADVNAQSGTMLMDHSAPVYFVDEQGQLITIFAPGVTEEEMTRQIAQHFKQG
ncbi:MAG: SCO family protein [Candidatus Symbiobacter sp.]|nr:SCO family protein [Candidatus Symbiobacter sp.]